MRGYHSLEGHLLMKIEDLNNLLVTMMAENKRLREDNKSLAERGRNVLRCWCAVDELFRHGCRCGGE